MQSCLHDTRMVVRNTNFRYNAVVIILFLFTLLPLLFRLYLYLFLLHSTTVEHQKKKKQQLSQQHDPVIQPSHYESISITNHTRLLLVMEILVLLLTRYLVFGYLVVNYPSCAPDRRKPCMNGWQH